ncbi:MAG: hypothetical protein ICV60_15020 [Pyrinomonadaceae bacterium]|nr:hypothetical protein [Pyrinomonadaceae bacterium]
MATKAIAKLAKRLASDLLKEAGINSEAPTPVPLQKIAKALDVPVVYREMDSPLRAEAVIWERTAAQPSLFGDVKAEIWGQGIQKRFALAHELSHRVAHLWLAKGQTESWTNKDWKDFLDEFAGHLLLPNSLLLSVVNPNTPLELTIQWIDLVHRQLRVSISCLLKRLNDADYEGILRLANGALVATPALSAKQKTNYAPRIQTICAPRQWFIPSNRRLSSLGLHSLSKLFWNADPFTIGIAEDKLIVLQRPDWQSISVNQTFHYVIYPIRSGEQKVMLATFRGPHQILS